MHQVLKVITYVIFSTLIIGCGGSKFMLDRGKDSYLAQDYRQAFLRLKPVAEAGNADAQYALAYMYYYGQGVIEDRKLALEWMKKSAAQGQKDALKGLEMMQNMKPTPYGPIKNPKERPW